MRPVVLSTRELPEPSLSTLEPDFEVRVLGYAPTELELAAEAVDASALITLVSDPVTEKVLDAAPKLKIVAQYAVGVDNIDRAAAAARGIARPPAGLRSEGQDPGDRGARPHQPRRHPAGEGLRDDGDRLRPHGQGGE